jgi:hypothetical protein
MNKNPANPANLIDIGKPIRFKFQTQNRKSDGQSIISGSCKLRTNDPRIIITDSSAGLNNVAWNNSAWSTNEFEFVVADTVTQGFTAYFDVIVKEDLIEYTTPCIPIPIKALTVHSRTVDDDDNPDSNGDGDGIVEFNESVETNVKINNSSEFDASYVEGSLLDFDGTGWNYNIYDSINIWSFGQVGASGPVYPTSWYNYNQNEPQPLAAGQTAVTAQFDFVYDYKYSSTYSFELPMIYGTGFYIFGSDYSPILMFSSASVKFNEGYPPVPAQSVGLNDLVEQEIILFPNPAKNLFSVKINSNESAKISVIDLQGRNILNQMSFIKECSINTSNWDNGYYYVLISDESGMIKTIKLLKQ